MSQQILLNESTASQRIVYVWSLLSNGTSPAQFEAGGQPKISVAGLAPWSSAGTLLSIDSTNGEYCVRLGTSDVSVAGPGILRYSSSSALETSIPFMIVGYQPYGSLSTFDSSILSVTVSAMNKSVGATSGLSFAPQPGTFSSTSVSVVQIDKAAGAGSGLSFAPAPGDYGSTVTVGVGNIAKAVGAISGLSFAPAPGTYSGFSVSVAAIDKAVGSTSGLSFGIVPADYSSKVTVGVGSIAGGNYSNVTISGLDSGVTIATGGIVSASFGAGSVDAVALNATAENAIADALLARNIQGGSSSGNSVGSAFGVLRNRVQIDGSTGTVYKNDGTTSWFTFSANTVSANSGVLIQVTPH